VSRAFSFLAEIGASAPLEKVATMSAPQIRGLAATIRSSTQRIADSAGKLAKAIEAEASGFEQDAADVTSQLTDMRSARADLRAALGLGGNGAPPLDDAAPTQPPASVPASSDPSPTASGGSGVTMERSPIGFVPRVTTT
jgi:hypothetical protein